MAIDEALLACFDPDNSLPLLRLYGWDPPAFSYGRFQKPEEILDLGRCREAGVPVVRRITGGGVIYHGEELTYSLVCPTGFIPGSRSVKEAFFHLTSFLLSFYRGLGLPAAHAADYYGDSRPLGGRTPLCFSGIESCDILINGNKIGGNAQRRLKNLIFQHGSIPILPMTGASSPFLLEPSPEIAEGTTSLSGLGVTSGPETLAGLLATAFSEQFHISFVPDDLSSCEKDAADGIYANIYGGCMLPG
jgi:lipoate-protein ligase A